jgi:hypothetical protein
MTGLLAAALVFGSVFVGCRDIDFGFEKNGGFPGSISIAALADTIAGLPANTAAAPHTVKLERTDITTGGVMGGINTAAANRYVILDLSDCYAPDNTITGSDSFVGYNPGPNDMNVIRNNQYIRGVILPSGLTAIGNYAFSWCDRLTSVTIPNSVTSIGAGAFWVCGGLTGITIPAGVTSIGNSAFYGCSGLTSVTIPGSVETIGDFAFDGCSGLASITIPGSVTSIGIAAFQGCSSLTSVTIPGSVETIGDFAFQGCSSLTSVTFGGSISQGNFYNSPSTFPGDLRAKYLGGGAGTYTRSSGSETWIKQ